MKESNQTIIKVIGVCVLIVLVTILATVLIKAGQGDATVPAPITPSVQAVPDNASMTAVMRDEYMKGCTSEGGNESYCRCTFNHLHNELGTQGLIDTGLEYANGGGFTEPMQRALSACISEFEYGGY